MSAAAEECLTISPFYFRPEYESVSSGLFPHPPLSSVAHLPLSVSSSLAAAKQIYTLSSMQGQRSAHSLSSCLCVFATFVLSPSFKVKLHVQKLGNPHPKTYLPLLIMGMRIIVRVRDQRINLPARVLCTFNCCPAAAAEIRAQLGFVAAVAALSLFNGHPCCASSLLNISSSSGTQIRP